MIGRVWRGWAKPETADAYEKLLTTETLPALHRIDGYKGSYFMRRLLDSGEVEFVEITLWDSMETIVTFAGEDCTRAVVPLDTQALLTRFDDRSVHFEATWCP
ncbi:MULTISPECIES: antibiotic biosynthesis monooxygenase [Agrobacterium]|uniref:antibiotic biosynthesis monooxygenase n=1 Tax=Agrobacterium TaxID=357 RepID=UPI00080F7AA2|nr:antibiotic biosynthesis monooxygenase [Agrobacterium sp. 13-2099-1-2]NSY46514.1 antibiotic biosynthesis monooxygenase [Agrobacterium tumefaciens]UZX45246.1 antibiotic biosynthesis monooxygenase [Agrobacterium sp. 13-2099-1-2]